MPSLILNYSSSRIGGSKSGSPLISSPSFCVETSSEGCRNSSVGTPGFSKSCRSLASGRIGLLQETWGNWLLRIGILISDPLFRQSGELQLYSGTGNATASLMPGTSRAPVGSYACPKHRRQAAGTELGERHRGKALAAGWAAWVLIRDVEGACVFTEQVLLLFYSSSPESCLLLS